MMGLAVVPTASKAPSTLRLVAFPVLLTTVPGFNREGGAGGDVERTTVDDVSAGLRRAPRRVGSEDSTDVKVTNGRGRRRGRRRGGRRSRRRQLVVVVVVGTTVVVVVGGIAVTPASTTPIGVALVVLEPTADKWKV